MFRRRPRRTPAACRRGVEATELALTLPVVVVLVFGALEVCEVVFLKQSLTVTTYEGSRLAARRWTTTADVTSLCDAILEGRRVTNATVTVTPAEIELLPRGTPITVTVRAPFSSNSSTRLVLNSIGDVVQSNTMLRE
ncbi:MAG: TadE/TadG family type IV pilus assembly protein [Planctomycetota bacterium]